MKKRPYIIAILILAAAAAYFIVSTGKATQLWSLAASKSATDLKQSGEPAKVSDSSSGVPVPNPDPANTTTGTKIQPNPKINPAHGLPGHHCDIKVGDPIPPGLSGTPQTSISPPPPVSKQNTPVVTAPGSTSAKLNPAHGQPGHRCEIQVGAPLPAG